jgi:hypothetical protein
MSEDSTSQLLKLRFLEAAAVDTLFKALSPLREHSTRRTSRKSRPVIIATSGSSTAASRHASTSTCARSIWLLQFTQSHRQWRSLRAPAATKELSTRVTKTCGWRRSRVRRLSMHALSIRKNRDTKLSLEDYVSTGAFRAWATAHRRHAIRTRQRRVDGLPAARTIR